MANYASLKNIIDQAINTNGIQAITGAVMNDTLKTMISSLGAGYQYGGIATPALNPGTPDQNLFYIAIEAGTYVNMGGAQLPYGISILSWNGAWSSNVITTFDSYPQTGSQNPIQSGAVEKLYGHPSIINVDDAYLKIQHVVDTSASSASGNRYTILFRLPVGASFVMQSDFQNIGIAVESFAATVNLDDVIKGNSTYQAQTFTNNSYSTGLVTGTMSVDGYLRIVTRKSDNSAFTNAQIQNYIESLSLLIHPSGIFIQHSPVSLIADYYGFIANIDTTTHTIDFGDDPILLIGALAFNKNNMTNHRSFDFLITTTTAVKVVFDIKTKTFVAKLWNDSLLENEILIGGIRYLKDSNNNITSIIGADFPFRIRINGVDSTTKINAIEGNTLYDTFQINNGDIKSYHWQEYTSGSARRGALIIPIPNPRKFSAKISVKSSSPYKFALTVLSRVVDGRPSQYTRYDMGWTLNSDSRTINQDSWNYSDIIPKFISIVATDISTGASSVSYSNMLANVIIDIEFTRSSYVPNLNLNPLLNVVAHRGFWQNTVPENSLDAYRWAAKMGFKYAETDICPTSDGVMVLMHDASINRTCRNASDYTAISSTVNVASLTLSQLRSNYVLASDTPKYRRPVPTYEEFLHVCREYKIHPFIELKSSGTTSQMAVGAYSLATAILGLGNFSFISFSYALLDAIRAIDTNITDLIYIGVQGPLDTNRINPHNLWGPDYSLQQYGLTEAKIQEYHQNNMRVAAWTEISLISAEVKQFNRLSGISLDYIIGDMNGVNDNLFSQIFSSEHDWYDFETNGSIQNIDSISGGGSVSLASGQVLKLNAGYYLLASYNLQILIKGQANISGPNLTDSVNSQSNFVSLKYCGLCIDSKMNILITATGNCTIDFVNVGIKKI